MDLNHLTVFQAVAQTQSFTKAAGRLGMDKSRVSRALRSLEEALGTTLLARTTRSVRLTPEGEALLRQVAPLLSGLQAAVERAPGGPAIPTGEVTLTAPPDVGRALLAPVLAGFRVRHPTVRVRAVLTYEVVDLLDQGVDLALRVGKPGAGSFVARKLMDLEAGFFASPRYVERRGRPAALPDLARHECLWPPPPRGRGPFGAGRGRPPPTASVECSDFGFLAELARAGGGVALLPTFLAAQDVALGSLVRLLPEVSFRDAPLFLVSRPGKPVPPRVQVLKDYLWETLHAAPRRQPPSAKSGQGLTSDVMEGVPRQRSESRAAQRRA
ncbi:LysR family transcriptional regulator [Pyxidicoccus fallax]|uniref:LysR family transcriptional regulator n=1 Tax=Pyxidicoccus fallax TaxID=394095 RepID=A0A848M1F8_9BACT|nr:LysR family transcriptional regulator [Pyxidicoccus fallax]NMO23572.1 LysR family transcriptional regulator [Pyxidicoccus fallax]NPC87042.1 LysR family transcriptional regulator [Pyxidicoccus fallax]